jgi:hypothetical protein
MGKIDPQASFGPTFATVRCENIKPTFASPLLCIAGFRPQAWLMLSASTTGIRAVFSPSIFFGDSPRSSLIEVLPPSLGGGGT